MEWAHGLGGADRGDAAGRDVDIPRAVLANAGHDHHDIAEMLKAAGARLGAIDHWALLISAAAAGHVEDVRDILARSPDKSAVNACDYDSRTPLHLAATEDRAEVVELLLTKGAAPARTLSPRVGPRAPPRGDDRPRGTGRSDAAAFEAESP